MKNRIQLLDCTLRDGCYVVNAEFGDSLICGLLQRLYAARVDIIECGWLKNQPHSPGSAFFHQPDELAFYLPPEPKNARFLSVMIDWDRYDLNALDPFSGKGADTIRMVFPHGKSEEAIRLSGQIPEKGYHLFFQAANTLSYSDEELLSLAEQVNGSGAEALSIVDTFGAMYPVDLDRIFAVLDRHLRPEIRIGFHSHNNQQLSFALSMRFAELIRASGRAGIIDSSLSGLGRGAGNTTTELAASFLNRTFGTGYDMNEILDAIDTYIDPLKNDHNWGYSTSYFIAGLYCCHVNNIAYLKNNHRVLSKEMRLVIESLDPADRLKYDYDKLEKCFIRLSDRSVDDRETLDLLRKQFQNRKILLLAPGRNLQKCSDAIRSFVKRNHPLTVGINSVPENFRCDWLFFSKPLRYEYAGKKAGKNFSGIPRILTSNIQVEGATDEWIVNYNVLIKPGRTFFDDSMIMFLRLLKKLDVSEAYLAGFDGFSVTESFNYADPFLQGDLTTQKRETLNREIRSMLLDEVKDSVSPLSAVFLTPSLYNADHYFKELS